MKLDLAGKKCMENTGNVLSNCEIELFLDMVTVNNVSPLMACDVMRCDLARACFVGPAMRVLIQYVSANLTQTHVPKTTEPSH